MSESSIGVPSIRQRAWLGEQAYPHGYKFFPHASEGFKIDRKLRLNDELVLGYRDLGVEYRVRFQVVEYKQTHLILKKIAVTKKDDKHG